MTPAELELIDLLDYRIDLLWEIEVNRNNPSELLVLHHKVELVNKRIKELRK